MILQKTYKKRFNTLKKPTVTLAVESKFLKEWAEYIYSKYASDKCSIGFGGVNHGSNRRHFREIDEHANGDVSVDKYKETLKTCDPKTGAELWKINWGTVSTIKQVKQDILGLFSSVSTSPSLQANDMQSKKQRKRIEAASRLQSNPNFKKLIQQVGVMPSKTEGITMPNVEAVDIAKALGKVRSNIERELEEIVDATLDDNSFDKAIKMQLISDYIDYNVGIIKVEPAMNTGRIKVKRVDPSNFICDHSFELDGRDLSYAGEVRSMKIHELRELGVPEVELIKIAKHYKRHNKGVHSFDFGTIQSGNPVNKINQYEVFVLQYSFVCDVAECYLAGVDPDNKYDVYEKKDVDYELTEAESARGMTLDYPTKQRVFSANWVIDTDYIFGENETNLIVRKGEVGSKFARLPFVFISRPEVSLVESAIPAEDDYNLALFKLRKTTQAMPSGSLGFDLSLMANEMSFGGNKYSLFEMMEVYRATGEYYYMSENEHGIPNAGSNRPPVHSLPTDDYNKIGVLIQEMARADGVIKTSMGVTQLDKIEDSNERMNMFTGDGQVKNNALKLLFDMLKLQVEGVSNVIVDLALEMNKVDAFDYELSEVAEEISCDSLGIDVEIIDIAASIREFETILNAKYAEGSITEDVKFTVGRLVRDGKIAKAEYTLATEVAKERGRKQQEQQQNIMLQSQQAEKAAQSKMQGELQVEQAKNQFATKLEQEKTRGKIALEQEKAKNEMLRLKFLEQHKMKDYKI